MEVAVDFPVVEAVVEVAEGGNAPGVLLTNNIIMI